MHERLAKHERLSMTIDQLERRGGLKIEVGDVLVQSGLSEYPPYLFEVLEIKSKPGKPKTREERIFVVRMIFWEGPCLFPEDFRETFPFNFTNVIKREDRWRR